MRCWADGKVYSGASPELAENLAKKAQQEDFFGNKKTAGVVGNNVFVVVNGTTTFIPLSEIKGKSDEAIEKIIVDAVVENVTRVAAEAAAAASELNESLQISADGSLPDLSGVAPEALAVPGFTPPSAEELAAMTDEEIIATLEQRQEALAAIQAADTAKFLRSLKGFLTTFLLRIFRKQRSMRLSSQRRKQPISQQRRRSRRRLKPPRLRSRP